MARTLLGLFLFLFIAANTWIACGSPKERSTSLPPNVVILVADDLGFADVGYRGSSIQTPGIDRLAKEGLRLERFYATPICTPTRAALMTGRDPLLLGLAYDQIHPWYNAGLAPDQETLPRAFQSADIKQRSLENGTSVIPTPTNFPMPRASTTSQATFIPTRTTSRTNAKKVMTFKKMVALCISRVFT